jgi:hypothetical protein
VTSTPVRAFSLALLLTLAVRPAHAARAAVPTLPVDSLRAGQAAVVRTVFEGSAVDTFGAVIVGVLRSGRADGDMILARATSERVVRSGVAQGMSGSPVYVEGRLVGALSSGWQFTREPLFGITPIGEMLPVLDLPARGGGDASAGPGGLGGGLDTGWRGLAWAEPAPAVAPPGPAAAAAAPARLALPLVCAGMAPAALEAFGRGVAPLGFLAVPGGRASGGGPPSEALVPGAAVAVDLMRGDLQLSAIGTVTYRDGDRVLLFGHPFFQAGDVRLPISTAEITTIVPSAISAFKLGVRGRAAGVAEQDRRTAVSGRVGGTVSLLPLRVTLAGPGRPVQTFRFECVEDRLLAPSLVGAAATNSLLESGGSGGGQTLRWTLRVHRTGVAPLVVTDVAAGDAPPAEFAAGVAGPLRFLFNNPFERLRLDSVSVDVAVEPVREQWTLRSARLLDAAVRPGGTARVRLEVERWRGEREVRTVDLDVPEETPEGRQVLYVGGAQEYTRYEATRLPARYRPTSLADAWERLGASRPSDGLYLALVARAPEITSDGRDYPELPLSALTVLGSAQAAGERGRRGDAALLDTRRVEVGGVVRGELLLNVNVDRKAP